MGTTFKHGTSSAYGYHKCRCEKCRAWKKQWAAQDHQKHRATNNQRSRAYREKNLERLRAYDRERKHYRTEEMRTYFREYQRADRPKTRAKTRRWREANPEKQAAASRAWKQRNPERVRAQWRAQDARRRGLPLDAAALEWIISLLKEPCVFCGKKAIEIDHITAVSKGGDNGLDNLAPVCRSCNARKGNKSLFQMLHDS